MEFDAIGYVIEVMPVTREKGINDDDLRYSGLLQESTNKR